MPIHQHVLTNVLGVQPSLLKEATRATHSEKALLTQEPANMAFSAQP